MRVLLVRLTLAFGLMLGCSVGAARAQKIAYIDSKQILDGLEETTNAKQRLETQQRAWLDEYRQKKDAYDKAVADFDQRRLLLPEEDRKKRQTALETQQKELEAFSTQKFGPNGEYFKLQADLMKPIQARIFSATQIVAEREKYDLVLDRSSDVFLIYSKPSLNATEAVLEEVNRTVRTGGAPAAASPTPGRP